MSKIKSTTMNEVLFVRVSRKMLDEIDALLKDERLEHPGRRISRSDLIREILIRELYRYNKE